MKTIITITLCFCSTVQLLGAAAGLFIDRMLFLTLNQLR